MSCTTQKSYHNYWGLCKQLNKKTEIQQLFENAGITDGTAYHRVNHLVDRGWCIGTVQEFSMMLRTNDMRLVQLESGQRQLLKKLVNSRS